MVNIKEIESNIVEAKKKLKGLSSNYKENFNLISKKILLAVEEIEELKIENKNKLAKQ